MRHLLSTIVMLLTVIGSHAQTITLKSEGRDANYVQSILGRAAKVTKALQIEGTDKGTQVTHIVANRYFELNDIYAERDSLKKQASVLTGDAKKKAQEDAENLKDKNLYRTHFGYIAQLALFLNEAEIEKVKDVMTYDVVNVTYKAQLDMIPSLKEEEKVQILAWLKEAREYAMDAESSKKKHETFGKYKGRINNYLSKRGYNLTKEREEWKKRVEARGEHL